MNMRNMTSSPSVIPVKNFKLVTDALNMTLSRLREFPVPEKSTFAGA